MLVLALQFSRDGRNRGALPNDPGGAMGKAGANPTAPAPVEDRAGRPKKSSGGARAQGMGAAEANSLTTEQ